MKKVDPPKIGHFRGGLLSSLLAKNPSKWLYYENFLPLWPEKCILSHLEGFLAKSEESRPPLKWPILGGSTFFTFSQKCLFTELEPNQVLNFNAILLLQGKFFQIFAFYKRWSYCIFPSIEHRHSHIWVFLGISTCPIVYGLDFRNTWPTREHGSISKRPPHIQILGIKISMIRPKEDRTTTDWLGRFFWNL